MPKSPLPKAVLVYYCKKCGWLAVTVNDQEYGERPCGHLIRAKLLGRLEDMLRAEKPVSPHAAS